MRVKYGPVVFRQVRCISMEMIPEKDPTGYDVTMTRVELEISFRWSPFATTSGANDNLGIGVRNLREILNTPRQLLRVQLGNDETWECPVQDTDGRRKCDPGYGPFPELISLTDIIGDKTGVGRWRVKFWVTDSSAILLSNRWTVKVETNQAGLTRRVIDGWATCRADYTTADLDPGPILTTVAGNPVVSTPLNGIDDFRRWFICPVPSGYSRAAVHADVNEINTVCHYRAVDQEIMNPMGADGAGIGAVKFEGQMTAGSVSAFKTHTDKMKFYAEFALVGPLALASAIPTLTANGWVKITGTKTADKKQLAKLAYSILQDRATAGVITAAACTQGFGDSENQGRWVKVALTFLPSLGSHFAATFAALDFTPLMNFSNDIAPRNWTRAGAPVLFPGGIPPNETDSNYKSYNLLNHLRPDGNVPARNDDTGCRGSWLGALLTQTLQVQGQPPAVPPNNKPSIAANLI